MRIFGIVLPPRSILLALSEFAAVMLCLIAVSFQSSQVDPVTFLLNEQGLARIGIFASAIVGGLYFMNLYVQIRPASRIALALQLLQVFGMGFLVEAVIVYLDSEHSLPLEMMIPGVLLAMAVLFSWRVFYGAVVWKAFGKENILFLGSGATVQEIAATIQSRPELCLSVLGCLDDVAEAGSYISSGRVLGPLRALKQVVNDTRPDRIVVGPGERRNALPLWDLFDIQLSGVMVENCTILYETLFGRVCSAELKPSMIIFDNELGSRPSSLALQSIYTNVVSLTGLLVAAPLMVLIAVAIRLTSRGPAIYAEPHVGLNGIPFNRLRFRCNSLDGKQNRLTPLGRWVQRLHLDVLPQWLNILRGEMALIGPRPEKYEFAQTLSDLIPYYRQRHYVKPGIMGWTQVTCDVSHSIEDSITLLEHDLYYIKHISLALDAYIVIATLKSLFIARDSREMVPQAV